MAKKKPLFGVVSTVDGDYNCAFVTDTLVKAKAEFRVWMKEHDIPEDPQYTKEFIQERAEEGYFDDGSGYVIQLMDDVRSA